MSSESTAARVPAREAPEERPEAGATPASRAAQGVGLALGALAAALARVRRARPLHPRGEVVEARLELYGGAEHLGPALGEAGSHAAVVRLSSGGGLPRGWPDVQGLALRWWGSGRPTDVLLSSTGLGPWSRYLLRPRRARLSGPFTTLMPFRGAHGPVVLAAVPGEVDERSLTLQSAGPRGPWQPFGTLHLAADRRGEDRPQLRFDPLGNCPPGLAAYAWTATLRTYAYRWAQAAWPG